MARLRNACSIAAVASVTGIGGFFFRAQDPDALNRWYADHFGVIMLESRGYEDPGWFQDRGETVFVAVGPDSTTAGPPAKQWKLNFRVDDLDGVVERLREAGVAVERHADPYPNGGFAELVDPEGNEVQLWEPNAASVARDPGPEEGADPAGAIIVAGHLEVDPAERQAFLEGGAEVVRLGRAAPGNLDFALSADLLDDGRVNVLERWESLQALHAFRGDGPTGDTAAQILGADVHDYVVGS